MMTPFRASTTTAWSTRFSSWIRTMKTPVLLPASTRKGAALSPHWMALWISSSRPTRQTVTDSCALQNISASGLKLWTTRDSLATSLSNASAATSSPKANAALMTAAFTQSCVFAVHLGCPGRCRRVDARHATASREPIPDTRTTTRPCCRMKAMTCLDTSSSRGCLDTALSQAGTMHGGHGRMRSAACEPGNGYVCKVISPSLTPAKMLASHSTAWNASLGALPCALACGTPGIPLAPPATASPSPTTMTSTTHLPAASYTTVGFATADGALNYPGKLANSAILDRGSSVLAAVDASTVARLAEPVPGALGGVWGRSPWSDGARDDVA